MHNARHVCLGKFHAADRFEFVSHLPGLRVEGWKPRLRSSLGHLPEHFHQVPSHPFDAEILDHRIPPRFAHGAGLLRVQKQLFNAIGQCGWVAWFRTAAFGRFDQFRKGGMPGLDYGNA